MLWIALALGSLTEGSVVARLTNRVLVEDELLLDGHFLTCQ